MLNEIERFLGRVVFFFLPGHSHPWDYVAHFALSLIGVILIAVILNRLGVPKKISLRVAIALMTFIGAGKEVLDAFEGKTDMLNDFAADMLGISLGVIVLFAIKKLKQKTLG